MPLTGSNEPAPLVGGDEPVAACEAVRDRVVVVGSQLDERAAVVDVRDETAAHLAQSADGSRRGGQRAGA